MARSSRAILDYRPIYRSLDIGYANLCVLAESRGILVPSTENPFLISIAPSITSSGIVPDFGYELGSGKPAFDNPNKNGSCRSMARPKRYIYIYIYIWIITCIHLEPCNRLHLREMAPQAYGSLWEIVEVLNKLRDIKFLFFFFPLSRCCFFSRHRILDECTWIYEFHLSFIFQEVKFQNYCRSR